MPGLAQCFRLHLSAGDLSYLRSPFRWELKESHVDSKGAVGSSPT